ncbi:mitochondrial thiamine pyrophosphate carrier [Manduca sexta]|uniref:Mitochondrial thiamine pyrophosphate carrier n=1 Tax=Manduca sexta TaxID=7130 RepID=A0A922CGY8_MANSE|nr:mitochondrial thiamine pyrophosphate carrier [Manduca sexta]KAG6445549.1 hypothetical protein O3G_MSEX003992 [Manduca sexta]
MVGYQRNDSMTANQKLIAGCVSGVMTRFITQPLDVIKVRTQLQKKALSENERRKWFRTTRMILKEEGIAALWHGHNVGQIHSILAVSSQFYAYELSTKYTADTFGDSKFRPFLQFLCGIFAGCCSATLVLPLDVIRVRQMIVKEQYPSIIKGAREVYATGGILAFYQGLNASLLQMGPAVGISFGIFNLVQTLILSLLSECRDEKCKRASGNVHKPENLLLASTVAGSISGFISKTLTYPFDLVKRRMQISTHKADVRFQVPSTSKDLASCTGLAKCFVQLYKVEGLKGLYRGFKVTIYKAQLTSVVAFTTYELFCYAIREVKAR